MTVTITLNSLRPSYLLRYYVETSPTFRSIYMGKLEDILYGITCHKISNEIYRNGFEQCRSNGACNN